MYGDVYSVSPAGVFVPADSPVKTPADLAGVPISVGFQSGSHYSTVQALEQYLPADKINLSFNDGLLFKRMELLIEGKAPAVHLFSGPYYFAEQLGFRKMIDTTFMIGTMVTGNADPEDMRKFFRALKRAQRDIDLRPDLYTHYYKKEFPTRWHAMMDTRRWGPGERLVFEPYTKEAFEESFEWIAQHQIFAGADMGSGRYRKLRDDARVVMRIHAICRAAGPCSAARLIWMGRDRDHDRDGDRDAAIEDRRPCPRFRRTVQRSARDAGRPHRGGTARHSGHTHRLHRRSRGLLRRSGRDRRPGPARRHPCRHGQLRRAARAGRAGLRLRVSGGQHLRAPVVGLVRVCGHAGRARRTRVARHAAAAHRPHGRRTSARRDPR